MDLDLPVRGNRFENDSSDAINRIVAWHCKSLAFSDTLRLARDK